MDNELLQAISELMDRKLDLVTDDWTKWIPF